MKGIGIKNFSGVNVLAIQLTESNLESVADWCNGSIKGIVLPRSEQVIQVWDKVNEIEWEAGIGDWVLSDATETYFHPMGKTHFEIFYRPFRNVSEFEAEI